MITHPAQVRGVGRKVFCYGVDGPARRVTFLAALEGDARPVRALAATPDGRFVVAATRRTLVVWAAVLEEGRRSRSQEDLDDIDEPPPRPFQAPPRLRFYMRYCGRGGGGACAASTAPSRTRPAG